MVQVTRRPPLAHRVSVTVTPAHIPLQAMHVVEVLINPFNTEEIK